MQNSLPFFQILMATGVAFWLRNVDLIRFSRSAWMKHLCYSFLVKYYLFMGCTLQVLSHEFYAWIEKEQGLLLQKSFPSETIKQKQQQKTPNPNQPQQHHCPPKSNNQTTNHSWLSFTVYIPDAWNESYLLICYFSHLQLLCENSCFECGLNKILCSWICSEVFGQLFTFAAHQWFFCMFLLRKKKYI